jgi:hypothetical protein
MHTVAECGMFYLQAAIAQQPGASWTAQRQSQAVDNIAVVLDAMGERGREGPLSKPTCRAVLTTSDISNRCRVELARSCPKYSFGSCNPGPAG